MKPKKFMNYRQTIDKTDGIACLIMALKYFGKITKIRKELELELYDNLCAVSYKTVLPSALVRELSSNSSFEVCLSISGNTIHNFKYYYPPDAFLGLFNEEENEYLKLKEQFKLIRNDKVTANYIKNRLDNGYLLLVTTYMPEEDDSSLALSESVLRWVVVYGYDNGFIYYSDPMRGNKRMKDSDFVKFLKTPLGEVCISVRKKAEEPTLSLTDEYSACKKQITIDLKYGDIAYSPNYELLFLIANGGDHEKIRSLICNEKNINSILMFPTEEGMFLSTYLIYALEKKNPMTVKLLLENGADANFTDYRLWGSSSAMSEIATAYIASPVDVHSCLLCANYLLAFGGNPDNLYEESGKTVRDIVSERLVKDTNTENERFYCEALQKMFTLNDAGELNLKSLIKILDNADRLFYISLGGSDYQTNGHSLFENEL